MAKTELTVDRILVSLDSLIDTRLGTILDMDPKAFARVVNKFYYERVIDEFNGIDQEEFKRRYAKRDVNTLKKSIITNVTLLLQSLIKSAANEVLRAGPQTRMIIVLNTHPYELTSEERDEMIAAMQTIIGDSCEFECVRIPLEFLTPEIVKSQFSVMVLYEFADWMQMHASAFEHIRMRNVVIYAPMLLQKKPTVQEMREFNEKGLDLFESARIAASPAFQLQFLTTDVFSLRDPVRDAKMTQMKFSDPNKVDAALAKQEQEAGTEASGEKSKVDLTPEEMKELLKTLKDPVSGH